MKVGVGLVLLLVVKACISITVQSQLQDETHLSTSQEWPEGQNSEVIRGGENEEDKAEDDILRRPRGKRRRRMRKRPRVHQDEEMVEPSPESSSYLERSSPEEEGVTPAEVPRRRPVKRRRRPSRRYQEEDGTKPPRRRRKGGRKRTRPEGAEDETQTEFGPTEVQLAMDGGQERNEATTLLPSKPIHQNTITEGHPEKTTQEVKFPQKSTVQGSKLSTRPPKAITEEQGTTTVEKPTGFGFGNRVFDRRKLFSNSRRLPVTSAIIRKLNTKIEANMTEEKLNNNYENQNTPITISPTELIRHINKIMIEENSNKSDKEDENEEEANYPKIIIPRPFFKLQNRTNDSEKKISATTEPTSSVESNTESEMVKEMLQEKGVEFGMKIEGEKSNGTDPSNGTNDFVVELMKTATGKNYLTKILEARNMTVDQLLEHRERGSSQFHLAEIFTEKNGTTTTSTTTEAASTEQLSNEVVVSSQPTLINVPTQNNENNSVMREGRESRIFESMPRFSTEPTRGLTEEAPQPTWRIIPNPKLRPVSVRGNYEEIPVAKLPSNINEIYLLDDREALIVRQRKPTDRIRDALGGAFRRMPVGVKSAIIISGVILIVAIFGFLSLLISCRVRQKRSVRRRAKQDILCEHLSNDDFMTSQQSLSPVLTKSQANFEQPTHHQHPNHHHHHHRHYYLWRTLRKTFRYD